MGLLSVIRNAFDGTKKEVDRSSRSDCRQVNRVRNWVNKKHNATVQWTDWRIIIREHCKGDSEVQALDAEPKRRQGAPALEQIFADMILVQRRNLGSFGSECTETERCSLVGLASVATDGAGISRTIPGQAVGIRWCSFAYVDEGLNWRTCAYGASRVRNGGCDNGVFFLGGNEETCPALKNI